MSDSNPFFFKFMIKAALFDVDGVVLVDHGYFSDRLAKEYNIDPEKIIAFFRGVFKYCQLGKADLKEELEKIIGDWGWEKSAEDLMEYWFSDAEINANVISAVKRLKEAGIACYLGTNQEKYRLAYLQNIVGLGKLFDGAFASCEIGHSKNELEYYVHVLNNLKDVKPEEVVFWDSDEKIAKIANENGFIGKHFISSEKFLEELKELGSGL